MSTFPRSKAPAAAPVPPAADDEGATAEEDAGTEAVDEVGATEDDPLARAAEDDPLDEAAAEDEEAAPAGVLTPVTPAGMAVGSRVTPTAAHV